MPVRLLVVNAIPFVGGAERWIVNLVRHLVPRGHEMEVAHHPDSRLAQLARAAGAQCWALDVPSGRTLRAGLWLGTRVRAGGHELVVSTSRADLKVAGIAARRAGHPGVVARLNSGWAPEESMRTSGFKWRRNRWYHRRLVQLGATNSRAGKEDLVARGFMEADRVVPIYNGVDTGRFDPDRTPRGLFRKELGIPEQDALVVSISRFAERKGQEYEVEAAMRLVELNRALHFAFLGPCTQKDRAYRERLVTRASHPRIRFLEAREDVPEILADTTLLVRAALTEGLPNCALEAMAMRVPVVATAICGTPEAVLDRRTGRLVPPRDVEALVRAISALLAAEDRPALGEAGRAHVLENFTLENMAEAYERLFERALAERRSAGNL
ncbi:MAG: glycosyltransferase family 4 protein [Planctomycetota bacterium]